MSGGDDNSWFGPFEELPPPPKPIGNLPAFARLWRGFMGARVGIALLLLLLQASFYGLGQTVHLSLLLLCSLYLLLAVAVRMLAAPRSVGKTLDRQWLLTAGLDILVFGSLQVFHAGPINYTPLFALPVLMAAVLGSLLVGLGTAAAVTLMLLADAWQLMIGSPDLEAPPRFLQAGLTGSGLFIVAFLAHQLSARLAREEQRARRSQRQARMQAQVNTLVIESLAEGVVVVDARLSVRATNPVAAQLMDVAGLGLVRPYHLTDYPGWRALAGLARQSFQERRGQLTDLVLHSQGPRAAQVRVRVRTQLTLHGDSLSESHCVMFLQDLREMEARMRTEKLAAMGRMSAAVAHEIRNPLAAIAQANALLQEDLQDPAQLRLAELVQQNVRRLNRTVEDVLDVSRIEAPPAAQTAPGIALDAAVASICNDWALQTGQQSRLHLRLAAGMTAVVFSTDHLQRILVNLLDNAARYASKAADAIEVATQASPSGAAALQVWSDGPPLEASVERHLFEPFFSSESRSSGLGLFICRELCERHGAVIGYQRAGRERHRAQAVHIAQGNEFFVALRTAGSFATIAP